MKRHSLLFALAASITLAAAPALAAPVTLDFDDIATPNCVTGSDLVPAGYMGFSWSDDFAVECDADYTTTYLNTTGAPSSPNATFNQSANPLLTLSRLAPFTFGGAMFSGWAFEDAITEGYTATDLTVTGFLGLDQVGTTGVQSLGAAYAFVSGFAGAIDRLELTTESGAFWLMDDFQYSNVDGPAPVPEPSTMLLLGLGLAGVHALRRSRMR